MERLQSHAVGSGEGDGISKATFRQAQTCHAGPRRDRNCTRDHGLGAASRQLRGLKKGRFVARTERTVHRAAWECLVPPYHQERKGSA